MRTRKKDKNDGRKNDTNERPMVAQITKYEMRLVYVVGEERVKPGPNCI